MNRTVSEWVDKAEADYRTAVREFQTPDLPNYDAVCFHAQQCIEKLMKAILIHRKQLPPRTHSLERVYEMLKPLYPDLSCSANDLRHLTKIGMAVRYPGETAERDEANDVMEICTRLRDSLKPHLPSR